MSTHPQILKICNAFKCTQKQAIAQLTQNAKSLQRDADNARSTGRKVRNLTADEWQKKADSIKAIINNL